MKNHYYCKKNLKQKSKNVLRKIALHSYQGEKKLSASGAKDLRLIRKSKLHSRS